MNTEFNKMEINIGCEAKSSDILAISSKILRLKKYFKENPKDFRIARLIFRLVQKRKKLLNYWSRDPEFYKKLLEVLASHNAEGTAAA